MTLLVLEKFPCIVFKREVSDRCHFCNTASVGGEVPGKRLPLMFCLFSSCSTKGVVYVSVPTCPESGPWLLPLGITGKEYFRVPVCASPTHQLITLVRDEYHQEYHYGGTETGQ